MIKTVFKDKAKNNSVERAKNVFLLIGRGFYISSRPNTPGKLDLFVNQKNEVFMAYGIRNDKAPWIALVKKYQTVADAEAEFQEYQKHLQQFKTAKEIEALRQAKAKRKAEALETPPENN